MTARCFPPSSERPKDTLLYIGAEPFGPEIADRCARLLGLGRAEHANTMAAGIQLISHLQPCLLVVGVDLPDANTFEYMPALRGEKGTRPVLLLCRHCDEGLFYEVHKARICAVVQQSLNVVEEIAAAARNLLAGKTWYSPAFREVERRLSHDSNAFFRFLTNREAELLREFALGATDSEIATEKGLAESTVQGFRKQILRKLNLHSSKDLIIWSLEIGLVRRRDFILKKRLRSSYRAKLPASSTGSTGSETPPPESPC